MAHLGNRRRNAPHPIVSVLHNLIASALGIHSIASAIADGHVGIANKAETERTTAVLVSREFGCEWLALHFK
jgi:hypothetical protein